MRSSLTAIAAAAVVIGVAAPSLAQANTPTGIVRLAPAPSAVCDSEPIRAARPSRHLLVYDLRACNLAAHVSIGRRPARDTGIPGCWCFSRKVAANVVVEYVMATVANYGLPTTDHHVHVRGSDWSMGWWTVHQEFPFQGFSFITATHGHESVTFSLKQEGYQG
jgi:hypothetical protein